MNTIPITIPISDLRTRQNQILAELPHEYVVLTQHGRPAAVMVSPDQWNRLMEDREKLQDALDAVEARRDLEPVLSLDEYLAQRGQRVQG
jgi:prevent-host-death family protein